MITKNSAFSSQEQGAVKPNVENELCSALSTISLQSTTPISKGKTYPVPSEYVKFKGPYEYLDVEKISMNRSKFIQDITHDISYYTEMKEIASIIVNDQSISRSSFPADRFPLINGMISPPQTKHDQQPRYGELRATSSPPPTSSGNPEINHFTLDHFDFMMSTPVGQKSLNDLKITKKVIFTPSTQRSNCAFLNRSKVVSQDYITVLVVRPSEWDNYFDRWSGLHMIRLPLPQAGVGYVRYWIQKLAEFFGLEYCWTIDDSVYSLQKTMDIGWTAYMGTLEILMESYKDRDRPQSEEPPSIKFAQVFVLMNIKLLADNEIRYCPALCAKEDCLISIDCLSKNILVIAISGPFVRDYTFENTGARSAEAGYSKTLPAKPLTTVVDSKESFTARLGSLEYQDLRQQSEGRY
ncbi:hypothetical protein PPL_08954 [Heterostelium album PN500]|uniref:TET-Associated Glycosyltransferase domain-containing protein n=1 Tax=Heterostelium pallidum (strain ATCC 26659 / Pp 5 / PN500) TaxID=670386 RepID=D3BK73_HETP5|nr:hypothetical protein PPL_08954 [Heterostelium album PN500]EFA78303.1 hypothetical protein PPL_08954 [Heterostelium album PN500]|eukprot:XP_020430428.1 hypothetical protein PPL_08954 [Heterostelium album PN500]